MITRDEYRKAQKQDLKTEFIKDKLELCSSLGKPGVDYTYADKYQIKDRLLMRRTVTEVDGVKDVVLRIWVPDELRSRVMRNAHDSAWGAHRNEKTTHKELVATHF